MRKDDMASHIEQETFLCLGCRSQTTYESMETRTSLSKRVEHQKVLFSNIRQSLGGTQSSGPCTDNENFSGFKLRHFSK